MRLRLRAGASKIGKTSRPKRGLGSLLKGLSQALGQKPCGGCNKRAKALDRFSDRLRF